MRLSVTARLITASVLFVAAAPSMAATNLFGDELVVNGGAEAGIGGGGGPVATIPGWQLPDGPNQATVVAYDTPGGFPTSTGPGGSVGGRNFFAGGPGTASATAFQFISVLDGANVIDSGNAGFSLSALLGGFSNQRDHAIVQLSFLGFGNSQSQLTANQATGFSELGNFILGPVTVQDRGSITGLYLREGTGLLPIGTRSLAVSIITSRFDGNYNDGYADNISLRLTDLTPEVSAVPEPATWAMMVMGFGLVGGAMRRSRAAPRMKRSPT